VRGIKVSLRPVHPGDESFLYDVYASTRVEELALVDWSDEQKAAFIRQQFEAQTRHYREHYPTATLDLILVDLEPAGRLYVDRWPGEIRVVDIVLLPAYQRNGIGERLLRELQAEASDTGRSVTIHVERFNPAQRLYARLGFVTADETGPVHLLMKWNPGST
jgi:ribosomal protein S18 acetylase RimI-like enzyme